MVVSRIKETAHPAWTRDDGNGDAIAAASNCNYLEIQRLLKYKDSICNLAIIENKPTDTAHHRE